MTRVKLRWRSGLKLMLQLARIQTLRGAASGGVTSALPIGHDDKVPLRLSTSTSQLFVG